MLPPPRSISPSPGGNLADSDIVGRDDDIARIWRALTTGTGALMLSEPRRLGKTLALKKLCSSPAAGWIASYHSYQGINTTVGMAEALLNELARHESLSKKLRNRVRGFLDGASATIEGVELRLAPQFRDDPIAAVAATLRAVATELGDRRLLLICDEVPDMIAAIASNESFDAATRAMGVWRAWREHPNGQAVRWLLTGSVGFHHIARLLGKSDLLNDLYAVQLGPIGYEWSQWLAESILLGAGIVSPDRAAVDELATLSGGFAMIIHLVGANVRDTQRNVIAAEDIGPILDRAFGDLDASQQLTSFLTRLAPYYTSDERNAYWLLDELAQQPADRADLLRRAKKLKRFRDEEHLREVLDWLTADHYLEYDDAGSIRSYKWRYEPLRRLWTLRRR